MQHPYGLEPYGNYLFKGGPNIREAGLGSLSALGDAQLLEVVGMMGAVDLGRLALVSKALYCFANQDELWKGLVIEEFGGRFEWGGCWQSTYLATKGWVPLEQQQQQQQQDAANGHRSVADGSAHDDDEAAEPAGRPGKRRKKVASVGDGGVGGGGGGRKGRGRRKSGGGAGASSNSGAEQGEGDEDSELQGRPSDSARAAAEESWLRCGARPWSGRRYLQVRGFYSDLLYQPWFCATTELLQEWLEVDNVDRRSGLSAEAFRAEYELPNRPVVLTDVMKSWPAMRKWSRSYMAEAFGGKDVIVGNMPMSFSTYLRYGDDNHDEMPLYLFDKKALATAAPALADDYDVPPHFAEDLFAVLGNARPDYRWLIMGPARSGSSFHVDPNATSAWNALVWGAKKWILYPPGTVPPGVHPSPDGADVATPLSLMEWFINFYSATQETKVRPIEFIARPGELLFVPRGWWHCALNLEDSCAVTQNYVSSAGLAQVLAFLRPGRADLVSGCAAEDRTNLHDRFVAALRTQRPHVLEQVDARRAEARDRAQRAHALAALFKPQQAPPPPGGKAEPLAAASATAGSTGEDVDGPGAATNGQLCGTQDKAANDACCDGGAGNGGGGGGGGLAFGFSVGGPSAEPQAAPAFRFGFSM